MSRSTRRRTLRAVAPVAGLLAAGLLAWQGSTAAFSATTANTADAWTTGSLALTNNGGGTTYLGSTSAVFAQTGMKIADTGTKCITVNSGGNVAGDLRLYRGTIGANGVRGETTLQATAVAAQIGLTVTAVNLGSAAANVDSTCTGFPVGGTVVVNGVSLSAMPSTYATGAAFAVPTGAQRVAYKFVWVLNTTGTNVGDNVLQGLAAAADLNWEIQ